MKNPIQKGGSGYLADREIRKEKILAGDRVPTLDDMREGLPPLRDDVLTSVRAALKIHAPAMVGRPDFQVHADALDLAPSLETIRAALDACPNDLGDLQYKLAWHAALLGDDAAAADICAQSAGGWNRLRKLFQSAFTVGLRIHSQRGFIQAEWRAGIMVEIVETGLDVFRIQRDLLSEYEDALKAESKVDFDEAEKKALPDRLTEAYADLLQLVAEDRAESAGAGHQHEVIVVPDLTVAGGKERKGVRDQFKDTAGFPLPLITRGDVAGHFTVLAARWPHLSSEIDQVLNDLATQDPIWIRPTILVGGAGTGKSSLARALGNQLGLPTTFFNAAGVSDGMFGGISANWSSSGCSIPLQCVNTSKTANPLVVIDEIEKAGTGRHNGNLVDTLLAFLDRGNAAKYRDPALEAEVDLSWVSYVMTANSLEGIPLPLRDRCRIVPIPDPSWKHVGDLVKHIVEDIAVEQGVDSRWHPPLAQDELDVVRKAWGGGSLRKLRRAVEILLQGRVQMMGRA